VNLLAPINEPFDVAALPISLMSRLIRLRRSVFFWEQVDNSPALSLDISKPGQLMSLLASGDANVMDIIPGGEEISVNSNKDALFLPQQIEKNSVAKCRS
jgi:hypothetical protein